jgi:toxin CptA
MQITFIISLVLAFIMGMAIQRSNMCMVVGFDDLIHRRSAVRLLTILSTWLMVPGGLAILNLMTGFQPQVKVFPVTVWSVIGGLLLGIGAVVTGACTNGVLARIGSGEYLFILTIVGFATGCILTQSFGPVSTIHALGIPTTVRPSYPLQALLLLLIVIALNGRGLVQGRHPGWRHFLSNAWDPRIGNIVVVIVMITLVQIYSRPWGYPELLGAVSRSSLDGILGGLALFASLLSGAIVGGWTCTRAKIVGPLKGRIIRCFLGGLIMGMGFSLGHGSFTGLTFFGQPLLLAYAWVVMTASYVSILLGLLYLRSSFGSRIKSLRK